jgi:hypothetical protein
VDPAEEIVNLWLKQQGFFVMNGVKIGYYFYDKFVGATEEGTGRLLNRCVEKRP